MNKTSIGKFVALSVLAGAMFVPGAAVADDAPLATVNGQAITGKDVDAVTDHIFRSAALKHLVMRTLIDQEAKKAGAAVTDADVDAALNQWKATAFGGDEARYTASLDQEGLTPLLYR
ncbi:MAG: SurA N-terminal domain-containing protein, partial [Armatimonadota bacterium]|nr:SurA N-terminal domain-containing protein [Armatimonadota bacterium]